MSYELAWEPRGFALTFSGRISFDDIRNATIDHQSDVRFDRIRCVVADFTRITGCDATLSEVDRTWAIDLATGIPNPRIRKAISATFPEVVALVMHYKAQGIPACPTAVSSSLGDARHWLAVEEHA